MNGAARECKRKKRTKRRPGPKAAPDRMYGENSDSAPKGFGGAIGVTRVAQDGGTCHSQSGNMGQGV